MEPLWGNFGALWVHFGFTLAQVGRSWGHVDPKLAEVGPKLVQVGFKCVFVAKTIEKLMNFRNGGASTIQAGTMARYMDVIRGKPFGRVQRTFQIQKEENKKVRHASQV